MTSLDSPNSFLLSPLHTMMVFVATFKLVDPPFSNNFTENQVIRDAKVKFHKLLNPPNSFDNHPLFFAFHSETSDPSHSSACTHFCREFFNESLYLKSDSVLIPLIPSSALAIVMFTRKTIPCFSPPPEFFLTNLQLYRCLPYPIQWWFFLWYFFIVKVPMVCGKKFFNWMWACFCCPCIAIKQWISHRGYTQLSDGDPENPPTSQRNSVPPRSNHVPITTQSHTTQSIRTEVKTNINREKLKSGGAIPNNVSNNETSLPPAGTSQPIRNNEPVFSLVNEFESLKKTTIVEKNVTFANDESAKEDLQNFEELIKSTAEDLKTKEDFEKLKEELSKKNEEQKVQIDSLKKEQTPDISEDEEIRNLKEDFERTQEEQLRIHKKEIDEMRRKRKEKQRETEEEFRKMKEDSHGRIATMLKCIQMRIRFEDKENEWSDILKSFRQPLNKIVTSYYILQEEFGKSKEDDISRSDDIISETKFLGKLVAGAQNVLADAYDKLESLSENYEDRIFLKMIMKPVSLEGQKCDSIGNSLVTLMNSPLEVDSQKRLTEAISEIDASSIPTTNNLKTNSVTARMEDYTNLLPAPFPDWYSYIYSN